MNSWERFEGGASFDIASLGYEDNVEYYEPTESYAAGEGVDVDYPSTPTGTISAMVSTPEETSDTDRGGRRTDADLVLHGSDDAPLPTVDSGEGFIRVEVAGQSGTYEVRTRPQTQDGLIRYDCVEVA